MLGEGKMRKVGRTLVEILFSFLMSVAICGIIAAIYEISIGRNVGFNSDLFLIAPWGILLFLITSFISVNGNLLLAAFLVFIMAAQMKINKFPIRLFATSAVFCISVFVGIYRSKYIVT
ncbi:hypothetical protein U1769_07080 [Sphingomonas sp. ZT3P38]|uniref:hypothetical protein n=1 Tax=Parasphingomonas zepuensis TaxID=3096161 RepID=UPI002FC6ACC1